ncbi:hypothetical protein BHM03_00025480 [Ensete ventricosum]|nr:hypothetical protein BHM03_00025480 [Ensete ventricosum]
MSQECLFGNSGAKHRTEPKHPQQAEEVTTAGPTPNRFWRMMTDPRFPSPASNPTPFVVTAEAFLGLTNQGIPDVHPSLAIQAFLVGLKPSRFFWSLIERPPTTVPEMLQRANQYIAAKTLEAGKQDESKHLRAEQPRGHPSRLPKRREDRSSMLPSRPPPIPLNSTRTEIFFQIQEKELMKSPNPMKAHSERRDKRRYCHFHREYDHNTKECRNLQYQIKDLIRHGHLRRYVRDQSSLPDSRPPRDPLPRPKGPIEKQIDVIIGGQLRAAKAPRRARLMHALRSERGLRMTKTLTSPSDRGAKSTSAMMMHW